MSEGTESNKPLKPFHEYKELFGLLVHVEALQHNRFYYYLVAQTLFFLAVGTVMNYKWLVALVSFCGLAITILFTIVNLKNALRVLWIIQKLKERKDQLYFNYLEFKDFDKSKLNRLNKWVADKLVKPEVTKDMAWISTGCLFTWGIGFIFGIAWLVLFIYGLCQSISPAPHTVQFFMGWQTS